MYLVFAGDVYYPAGGWEDYIGERDTLEAAEHLAKSSRRDWWQIVHAGKIVKES